MRLKSKFLWQWAFTQQSFGHLCMRRPIHEIWGGVSRSHNSSCLDPYFPAFCGSQERKSFRMPLGWNPCPLSGKWMLYPWVFLGSSCVAQRLRTGLQSITLEVFGSLPAECCAFFLLFLSLGSASLVRSLKEVQHYWFCLTKIEA